MILAAFGDSFIYGSDLSDCPEGIWVESKKTYPALAAKQLNLEYICTALPAQGNMIIYDDICRTISSYGSSAFYYVNWTYSDRFDYISLEDNFWKTILPTCSTETEKFYYRNLHAELTDKLQTLTYIANAVHLLEKHNCDFLMTCMDHIIFSTQWHCPPSIELLQYTVSSHIDTFEGKDFLSWAKVNQFDISKNNHPLEQAHQVASEILANKIQTIINNKYPAKEDYNASK